MLAAMGIALALPSLLGQETQNGLPDVPQPEESGPTATSVDSPTPPVTVKHRWFTVNNVAFTVLVAGEGIDSWTTFKNLTHHKWICGYGPAFGSAVTYISDDGVRYDPQTVQHVLCGLGPSGQVANYAYDVTRTGAFTETGWVTQFHLAGSRNYAAVNSWNLADDLGQFLIARYLSKRKGPARRLGSALMFSRGIVRIYSGVLNIRFARKHRNPNGWYFNLPDEPHFYPGPRWWGKQ